MTNWPRNMAVDPIGEWPGELTRNRRRSSFGSPMGSTLDTLTRELRGLEAKDVRLQVAIAAGQFRLDGYPRSTARAEHPGIILTMQTNVGALSYPCDTFTTWEDNLRAIALALEALRKVDRYGVTKRGEQYRGFLAIEGSPALALFTSCSEAEEYLRDFVYRSHGHVGVGYGPDLATVLRRAQRFAHPDTGGDADTFQRVTLAKQYLKQNGAI